MYTVYDIYINIIVTLSHPWSGDIQGQVIFLAPTADKET